MFNDYTNKAVLITGGTKGIGLATALIFAKVGAQLYLTHRWGSADEDEIRSKFDEIGAKEPAIIEADASLDADTVKVMGEIKKRHGKLEVLISNVCVVPTTEGFESYTKRAMLKSLEYSAWPFVAYTQQAHKTFGSYPRYVIGLSSDGADNYYQGYEYVALSKTVMEILGRYLAKRLINEDVRINMVRTRNVLTESALAIHGQEYPEFVKRYASETHFIEAEEVGETIYAICSGLLDALSGQIINVDNGGPFSDTLMRVYREREKYGL